MFFKGETSVSFSCQLVVVEVMLRCVEVIFQGELVLVALKTPNAKSLSWSEDAMLACAYPGLISNVTVFTGILNSKSVICFLSRDGGSYGDEKEGPMVRSQAGWRFHQAAGSLDLQTFFYDSVDFTT